MEKTPGQIKVETMESELLPCPFCGSSPVVDYYGRNGIEIKCKSCVIKYKQKTIRHDLDWLFGQMKETWNNRTNSKAINEEWIKVEVTEKLLIELGFTFEERGKESDFDGVEKVYHKDGIDIYCLESGGFAYATYTRYPGRGFKAGINIQSCDHLKHLYKALTLKDLPEPPK
jgi:hypothetical protein